ncbi:MAG: ABC transporter substrate-binding protein [Cetobacterium sp.]|uniref:ABC transporter substrate-binding protein n=1 Tax=Cetobacterium sp. TaxID=2071632 RepID=UPI003F4189D6
MKKRIVAVLMAFALLGLGGCSDEKPEQNTRMVVPIKVGFNSIAPDTDFSAATKEVIRNMNAGLMRFDPDTRTLVPGLAESYTVTDDGRTYTFKLRDNLKFHNGKTITGEDVKYSFERVSGLKTGKPIVGDWNKNLKDVKVIDDKTVEIDIKDGAQKSSDIYNIADVAIIPNGISEQELEKHPIGAGPYKFVEYIPGQKIVLEAFNDYYLGAPDVKEVEFKVYKEGAGRILSFKNGEIDYLPLDVESLKEIQKDKNVHIVSSLGNDVNVLYLNNSFKPFQDKRVRQAIWEAIDIQRIIKGLALPEAAQLGSHMSPYLKEFYENGLQNKYPYNPEKARELLMEAGYNNNLSFTLTTISENTFENDMALFIKEDLAKVGVTVNVNPIPWGQYLPEVYKQHKYEAALLRVAGYPDPHRILQRYETGYSSNMGEYSNSEVDQLLAKASKTYDQQEKIKIYKKIQDILNEDIAAVYLMDQGVSVALSPRFIGYKTYPYAYIDISSIKIKKDTK